VSSSIWPPGDGGHPIADRAEQRPWRPGEVDWFGLAQQFLAVTLKDVREAMLAKVGGLSEYDARRWDVESERLATMWATEDESRAGIVDRYRRAWDHSDATIDALALDAPGHVEWWPRPGVKLFDVLVHMLAETSRHAGHADILREEIDGAVGPDAEAMARKRHDAAFWAERRARIELAARAAGPADA
jgi:hypothetical protein